MENPQCTKHIELMHKSNKVRDLKKKKEKKFSILLLSHEPGLAYADG